MVERFHGPRSKDMAAINPPKAQKHTGIEWIMPLSVEWTFEIEVVSVFATSFAVIVALNSRVPLFATRTWTFFGGFALKCLEIILLLLVLLDIIFISNKVIASVVGQVPILDHFHKYYDSHKKVFKVILNNL